MREAIRQAYWAVLFLLTLAGGFMFLDAVAASGGAQNLIRDMWPEPIEQIDCGERK